MDNYIRESDGALMVEVTPHQYVATKPREVRRMPKPAEEPTPAAAEFITDEQINPVGHNARP